MPRARSGGAAHRVAVVVSNEGPDDCPLPVECLLVGVPERFILHDHVLIEIDAMADDRTVQVGDLRELQMLLV